MLPDNTKASQINMTAWDNVHHNTKKIKQHDLRIPHFYYDIELRAVNMLLYHARLESYILTCNTTVCIKQALIQHLNTKGMSDLEKLIMPFYEP